MTYRIEKDSLGERQVPAATLYGIHTLRARENFPLAGRPVNPALIHAYGVVKRACCRANQQWRPWPDGIFAAMEQACSEMQRGLLDEHILVDALQGGAGTSTNMNINEVLANRALQILDRQPGDYTCIHPLDDLNRHQSTNDTYPTALKVAALEELARLEPQVIALLEAFQVQEKKLAHVVKIGRTQFQDAVLTTLGREMGAYAEALARDRWRLYKCRERLRVVALGGTAIGTGLGAPRSYIFRVVDLLRELTNLPIARAENLVEATQNTDVFVEVSGLLKTLASNLLKISTDLRFLSSGPRAGIGELRLPPRQAGSSIMPGKVNPVIPEAISQAALQVFANDQAITQACSMGHLELNAFLPLIADRLLEGIQLMTRSCAILRQGCVAGLTADEARCRMQVENATAAVTALVEVIGYEAAAAVAAAAEREKKTVRQIVLERGLLNAHQFDRCISPEQVMRLGSVGGGSDTAPPPDSGGEPS
ncbi:MAG: aspartate ammonia-lyase [Sedimentisphaerales bacterium]|nr:aspartate ammonia-lyase [Sedimentisphaerales bacterium]